MAATLFHPGVDASMPPHLMRFHGAAEFIYLVALVFHIGILAYFMHLELTNMVLYNLGSCVLYFTCFLLNRNGKRILAYCLAIGELLLHNIIATIVLGWISGFHIYFVAASCLIFTNSLWRMRYKVFVISFVLIIYILLRMYALVHDPLVTVSSSILAYTNIVIMTSTVLGISLFGFYFDRAARTAELNLEREHKRAEDLLLNILPPAIADRLKASSSTIADRFQDVSILFADISGFTRLSSRISPETLVSMLNDIFSRLDDLVDQYGLEKIKTIGDAYMVASGLPEPRVDHARAMAEFALDVQSIMDQTTFGDLPRIRLRVGMNCGQVVAGVIGKKKFIYDLWGDTVNMASRMESRGLNGCIQVTEEMYDRLKDNYVFKAREAVYIKGKGFTNTYLLTGRKAGESLSVD